MYQTDQSFTQNLIELMAKHGGRMTFKDICARLPQEPRYIGAVLSALKNAGRASRPARGVWALSGDLHVLQNKIERGIHFQNRILYPVEMWPPEKFFQGAIRQASKRLLECDIDVGYLMQMLESQDGRCSISGLPMTFIRGAKFRVPTNCSVDRIDSSRGYVRGNVQLVCWFVNVMKQDLTNEQVNALLDATFAMRKRKELEPEIGFDDWQSAA